MKPDVFQEAEKERTWEREFTEVRICRQHHLQGQAQLSVSLAAHLSMVAGQPDGEDSSGQQKLRLMTPDEVAVRATDIASALYKQFEDRGWILDLPLPRKIEEKKPDEEAA